MTLEYRLGDADVRWVCEKSLCSYFGTGGLAAEVGNKDHETSPSRNNRLLGLYAG